MFKGKGLVSTFVGENVTDAVVTNEHVQPERRWDVYYTLDAPEATVMNDNGGVHVNSSMLNIVSYKLSRAGMSVEEQTYFWMNVALAMVPTNDFSQMAELLPWVLEESGYNQYTDALKQAIDDAGYTKLEEPAELPAGAGAVKLIYPNAEAAEEGQVRIVFIDEANAEAGNAETLTWPVTQTELARATLPAGNYYVVVMVGAEPSLATSQIYTDKGWVPIDFWNENAADKGTPVHVEAGKTVELAADGLV